MTRDEGQPSIEAPPELVHLLLNHAPGLGSMRFNFSMSSPARLKRPATASHGTKTLSYLIRLNQAGQGLEAHF